VVALRLANHFRVHADVAHRMASHFDAVDKRIRDQVTEREAARIAKRGSSTTAKVGKVSPQMRTSLQNLADEHANGTEWANLLGFGKTRTTLVRDGYIERHPDPNKNFLYRLTAKGRAALGGK